MAGLRFTELQSRPMEFLDFTSLTLDEFQQLVPPFETNRDIISFAPVRILADCVEASKSWNINIPLYTASEPMKRLSRRVTCSNGIHQTQSPSLRIYVKEFMTGFVKRCRRMGTMPGNFCNTSKTLASM